MTLEGAIGRTGPGPEDRETLAALLEDLSGDPSDLLVPVGTPYPAHCLDGRPWDVPSLPTRGWSHPPRPRPVAAAVGAGAAPTAAAGVCPAPSDATEGELPPPRTPAVARLAGGTLSTWIVDLLLTQVYRPEPPEPSSRRQTADGMALLTPGRMGEELQTWTPAWLSLTCAALRDAGLPVSSHTDDHAGGGDCGCGAADSLGTVLALLGQHPAGVDALLRQWGIDPADVPEEIGGRCGALALTLPHGDSIAGVVSGYAQSPLPVMHGHHREVAVVANAVTGTSVDVPSLARHLAAAPGVGTDPQAFVLDIWSFDRVADFYLDRADPPPVPRTAIVATLAAFNAATLLTLCSPDITAVTLRA